MSDASELRAEVERQAAAVRRLHDQVERLRKGLRFYAEHVYDIAYNEDRGRRAERLLESSVKEP